ncbi:hypothetical protein O7621_17595 [Solwaraspora sp. WMMD937]|uniref:hypothetical protein n=1 Tax=Solwaraspora sp. WMMD937 TaxID=3016090 RepID=UPI00249A4D6D|nr:hypothetical protein [Solwaraspora sp. WMMD937]WFE19740.1 hypothetical protein O7621_17595 [Solwaraspora sp. WMMD937]
MSRPHRTSAAFALRAFATARGVTVRGLVGYLLIWLFIAAASRFTVSATGLQFAPPGSAALDTVAVILLLLPAGVLAGTLTSRTPHLEATRSRSSQPAHAIWVIGITAVGLLSPWLASPLVHPSIDMVAFFTTWCTVLGLWWAVARIGPTVLALSCTFIVLAGFSTPGLVPWHLNIVYNVEIGGSAALVATTALGSGTILQALLSPPPSRGSGGRCRRAGRPAGRR